MCRCFDCLLFIRFRQRKKQPTKHTLNKHLTIFSGIPFDKVYLLWITLFVFTFHSVDSVGWWIVNDAGRWTHSFPYMHRSLNRLYRVYSTMYAQAFSPQIPIEILYQCQHNRIKNSTSATNGERNGLANSIQSQAFMNYWEILSKNEFVQSFTSFRALIRFLFTEYLLWIFTGFMN